MPTPAVELEEYLERVALATATLLWSDLAPRGVAVSVEGGGARIDRALLGGAEFSLEIAEDVVEPAAGGGAVGRFAAGPYQGLLERQPDQVAFLLDPAGGGPPLPAGIDAQWCTGPIDAPSTVDAEAWSEYGFPRAVETVTLHKGEEVAAYGCLMPFASGIVEAALLVERRARGLGMGGHTAEALFERAAARDAWCHWATLVSNPASQRLGRLRRRHYEARITAYAWS